MSKTKKTPAASLKRRKHGLGLPIHIKKVSILLDIRYYIILVLNRLLYINYIQFPSRIRMYSDIAIANFAPRGAWEECEGACLPRGLRSLQWRSAQGPRQGGSSGELPAKDVGKEGIY